MSKKTFKDKFLKGTDIPKTTPHDNKKVDPCPYDSFHSPKINWAGDFSLKGVDSFTKEALNKCMADWLNTMSHTNKDSIRFLDSEAKPQFFFELDFLNKKERASSQKEQEDKQAAAEEATARKKVESWLLKTEHDIKWDDVVGNEKAKAALVDAIESPLKHARIYKFMNKKPSNGILLFGPAGCGKTMFGKAAASLLAKHFGNNNPTMLSLKGNEVASMWYGQTEERVRDIFAYAKTFKKLYKFPLVVFIDEADALLPNRNEGFSVDTRVVSTFLTEMNGMSDNAALVILATNRPEAIDEAILRDGRIDRRIKVERPTRAAANKIILRALETAPHVGDAQKLADLTCDWFYSPLRIIAEFHVAEDHVKNMCLGHIVNGAMLVGLVERAKSNAAQRAIYKAEAIIREGGDVEAMLMEGITEEDLFAAVQTVEEEAKGMPHIDAKTEFAEQTIKEMQQKQIPKNLLN